MELLLNAIWLLLLGTAAVLCSFRRSSQQQVLRSSLAVTCALLLLFPVISVTDDLHDAQFAMDDFSASKKLHSYSTGASQASHAIAGMPSLPVFGHDPLWRAVGRIDVEAKTPTLPSSPRTAQSRAPPSA